MTAMFSLLTSDSVVLHCDITVVFVHLAIIREVFHRERRLSDLQRLSIWSQER